MTKICGAGCPHHVCKDSESARSGWEGQSHWSGLPAPASLSASHREGDTRERACAHGSVGSSSGSHASGHLAAHSVKTEAGLI